MTVDRLACHVDRIDRAGMITQHRYHQTKVGYTACGARIDLSQEPSNNRRCRNCYPELRDWDVPDQQED